jgi:hypothetical protein
MELKKIASTFIMRCASLAWSPQLLQNAEETVIVTGITVNINFIVCLKDGPLITRDT